MEAFEAGFRSLYQAEGDALLERMGNALYPEDLIIGEVRYSVRRIRDTRISPESGLVRTEFYCVPQDGAKKKLERGWIVYLDIEAEDPEAKMTVFHHPKGYGFIKPDKRMMYHGVVAEKARDLIRQAGDNSFLHHEIMIMTPEKTVSRLDEFAFSRYPLFMLGFVSGEFDVFLQEIS
ncbi:MAG TPA: hypothetical protein DCF42_00650 [Lachnospiraceae bacterium]|nr:hypothetical protein [Lachnospiraceae bacterium]